jgi:site-specific DNA-methyltransferase (adenine-specific)
MTPYYEHGGIRIYHGDTFEVLAGLPRSEPIDCVATDPPYASGARTEAEKKGSGAMQAGSVWRAQPIMNDQMTTQGFLFLIRHVFLQCAELMRNGAALFAFIDWRQWPNMIGAIETCDLRVNSMIVWDKLHAGLGHGFRNQHELVAFCSKGTPEVHDKTHGNVVRCKRVKNEDHPSTKPVPLMRWLMEAVVKPGDLVLDPFMGAGSTLVAAKDLGCRAIGIEAKERFCEAAARKLSQGVLDLGDLGTARGKEASP